MSVAFSRKVRAGERPVTVAAEQSRLSVSAAMSGTIAWRSFGSMTLRPPNSSRTSFATWLSGASTADGLAGVVESGRDDVADTASDAVLKAFAEPPGRGTAGAFGEGVETVVEGPVVEGDVHVLGEPVHDAAGLGERGAALEGHRMGVGHGEEGVEHPAHPAHPDVLLQDDGGSPGIGGRGFRRHIVLAEMPQRGNRGAGRLARIKCAAIGSSIDAPRSGLAEIGEPRAEPVAEQPRESEDDVGAGRRACHDLHGVGICFLIKRKRQNEHAVTQGSGDDDEGIEAGELVGNKIAGLDSAAGPEARPDIAAAFRKVAPDTRNLTRFPRPGRQCLRSRRQPGHASRP